MGGGAGGECPQPLLLAVAGPGLGAQAGVGWTGPQTEVGLASRVGGEALGAGGQQAGLTGATAGRRE